MNSTKITTIALMLLTAILLMAVGSFFAPSMIGEHGGPPCVFQVMGKVSCGNTTAVDMAILHATHHWKILQSLLVAISSIGILATALMVLFATALLLIGRYDPSKNAESSSFVVWYRLRDRLLELWAAAFRSWSVRTQDLQ